MKNKALSILAIGAVLVAGVLAQPLMSTSANSKPAQTEPPASRTVTVVGVGQASATPDMARVTVGVDVVNPKLNAALTEVNKKTSDVIAALKKIGIEEKDIRTLDFSVQPQQAYGPSGPGPITGYRVSNAVRVTVRDLDKVGPVLDSAVNAGANSIQGLVFTLDDAKPVQAEARKAAMADAKFKADALASDAGVTVGKVLTISEIVAGNPMPMFQMNAAAAAPAMGGGIEVAPGLQDVQVQVQVVYEIE